jgi:hypothetical protein
MVWRRALWQTSFLALLVLVAMEITGFGQGIGAWRSKRPSFGASTGDGAVPKSTQPILAVEFRVPVT